MQIDRTTHLLRGRSRLPLVTIAILAMILTACSGSADETADSSQTEENGQTEEDGQTATEDEEASGDGESFTINVGHVLSSSEAIHKELIATADRIEERSEGRLVLEIFPDSTLGNSQDMTEQAVAGSNIVAHIDLGYASDHAVPDMAILNGPFLFDTTDEIDMVLNSDLFSQWTEQLAAEGDLVSLSWNWYFGQRHIIANKGVPTPSDMQGMSIRVPPNPAWIETFATLPAEGTQLEWSEVYSGLAQGVVDAAEAPLSTLMGSSLHEVADTITLTGHFKAITGMVIGQSFWETLPDDLQQILREEFRRGGDNVTIETVKSEPELQAELEELGLTFVEADVEAYAETVQPFYDQFPEWSDGLYEQVQELLADS